MGDDARAVVVWVPPHQRGEAAAAKQEAEKALTSARQREAAARLAIAKATETNAEIIRVGADLVLDQLKKWLAMAALPDFANSTGPIEPTLILKLAEFVQKSHRLDTGQATENVAHTIAPAMDFSKLSQEERDTWKRLALKGNGGADE